MPHQRQDHRQVGIGDEGQQLLPPAHLDGLEGLAGDLERHLRAVEQPHLAALQLAEQVPLVPGHQVDELLLQRLGGGVGRVLLDRRRRRGLVAAPLADDAAQVGQDVVLHLLQERLGPLVFGQGHHAAERQQRVGRAGVGPLGHGGHVGGDQDEEARRRRVGAAGGHVDHHRHPAVEDLADDVLHGRAEAAGRVQLQKDEGGRLLLRLLHRLHDEAGADGIHRPVQHDADNGAPAEAAASSTDTATRVNFQRIMGFPHGSKWSDYNIGRALWMRDRI